VNVVRRTGTGAKVPVLIFSALPRRISLQVD
jgi:hypothetical protein